MAKNSLGYFPEKNTKLCNRRYSTILFIFDFDCELFRSYFEIFEKKSNIRVTRFPDSFIVGTKNQRISILY
ncbi:predicted protein [Methanosarcina acetivorans C2A]|uniref:Uncharacterized protein n=1 Tax=Methanosarcina acetivorans (strain ATCC 35395 / DSM 2834 / JCM 12185 / C2A) TaxID=188937 RepID=Q8TKR5_METAC|nr:predicted protein [Methanosarcina acetivorans C2A]